MTTNDRPLTFDGEKMRPLNDAEFEQYKIDQKAEADKIKTAQAKADAKKALLDKLGITEDEAELLLS